MSLEKKRNRKENRGVVRTSARKTTQTPVHAHGNRKGKRKKRKIGAVALLSHSKCSSRRSEQVHVRLDVHVVGDGVDPPERIRDLPVEVPEELLLHGECQYKCLCVCLIDL